MDEVAIVDRVQVDVEDLDKFDNHVAIRPAKDLVVVYQDTETGKQRRETVHGFNARGDALVASRNAAGLVPASQLSKRDEITYLDDDFGGEVAEGPFTPAPPGLTAVFSNGQRVPIAYFDVKGRAVVIEALSYGGLVLLSDYDHESEADFVRIETEPRHG